MINFEWLILVISLPGRSAASRMRIWRALKASGAGTLRDGVYVLPQSPGHRKLFNEQAEEANRLKGRSYVLGYTPGSKFEGIDQFQVLFDRSADYDAWKEHAAALRERLNDMVESAARREEVVLRRQLGSIVEIDFFAGAAKTDAEKTMSEVSESLNQLFSPDEPTALAGLIDAKIRSDYRQRTWATRENLWVDRVASAWLIKRHIDPKARFLWLESIEDCPPDAVGFDFDGATFTHVERFVTFEVLIRSFGMEADQSLMRMGELVHYLDVGGVSVAEAPGLVALLSGVRSQAKDDDGFARRAFSLLDSLYAAYSTPVEGER